jgi:hypothetical protein
MPGLDPGIHAVMFGKMKRQWHGLPVKPGNDDQG